MNELESLILDGPLVDSHEHMIRNPAYSAGGNDVLSDIFNGYIPMDLISAGAPQEKVADLFKGNGQDITKRFEAIRPYWEACRHSGYGEGVVESAALVYQMEAIDAERLEQAQEAFGNRSREGERLRLLRDVAGLDHIQVDDMTLPAMPDEEDPDFVRYDLTWWRFSDASFEAPELADLTGCEIRDTATLRSAFERLFEQAPHVVAIKSQHAYTRTLAWEKRSDAEVEPILQRKLKGGKLSPSEAVMLGDWCLAEGVRIATEHRLPVKLHTGYLAHNNNMILENARVSRICPLLKAFPETRFVLMHIASAFESELLAIVRHYPGAVVDMCWAWAINPFVAKDFIRRFLRQVPVNKLLAFGGDCGNPVNAVAYSRQARRGLLDTLQTEIRESFLTEEEAVGIARRFMRDNAYAIFPALSS